jgi:hypothetical protein
VCGLLFSVFVLSFVASLLLVPSSHLFSPPLFFFSRLHLFVAHVCVSVCGFVTLSLSVVGCCCCCCCCGSACVCVCCVVAGFVFARVVFPSEVPFLPSLSQKERRLVPKRSEDECPADSCSFFFPHLGDEGPGNFGTDRKQFCTKQPTSCFAMSRSSFQEGGRTQQRTEPWARKNTDEELSVEQSRASCESKHGAFTRTHNPHSTQLHTHSLAQHCDSSTLTHSLTHKRRSVASKAVKGREEKRKRERVMET